MTVTDEAKRVVRGIGVSVLFIAVLVFVWNASEVHGTYIAAAVWGATGGISTGKYLYAEDATTRDLLFGLLAFAISVAMLVTGPTTGGTP